MNKTNVFVFLMGAAIGSVTAWYFTKQKYESILQEEIDSVKEAFQIKREKKTESKADEETTKVSDGAPANIMREKPSIAEYAKKLASEGYKDYSTQSKADQESKPKDPYVISPDEFGTMPGYDQISLTYYADHILTDDDNEMLEDVEGTVGWDSLNHFGEYEDDSVFVRNERLQVDYEILLDQRDYADVVKTKPYLMGDR